MDGFRKRSLSFLLICSLISHAISAANDTIGSSQTIKDGETLVSRGGIFVLGFFSPGNSTNRYLGIWYKNITVKTYVWVANRQVPLATKSGVLKVMEPGILALLNESGGIIWSSNKSRRVQNPAAQLLDSGNLIVKDANDDKPGNFVWQSFDHPSDTYLPGMMSLGWNLVKGEETYLSSWKNYDDPAPGDFTAHLDPTGYPQIVLKRGKDVQYRIGPWNGLRFSGAPDTSHDPINRLTLRMDKYEVRFRGDTINQAALTRSTVMPDGGAPRWTWNYRTQAWTIYTDKPADNCDRYGLCGAYGSCNIGNSPHCGCLDRFVPKDPEGWISPDWSKGCIRRTPLSCQGDVFLKYSGIKLPDSRYSSFDDKKMHLAECEAECLRNCSCTAYTQLDIREPGNGCLFYYGDLIDIRTIPTGGQDLYIRMASTEFEPEPQQLHLSVPFPRDFSTSIEKQEKKRPTMSILLSIASGVLLSVFINGGILLMTRQNRGAAKRNYEDLELPSFKMETIVAATNNFSRENIIGEGGFGRVYRGSLSSEEEIAIKRMSRTSGQGHEEFKNEVILIAKLQHRNLVRLLGCCIEGEERILIYEYMQNKSLDYFVFDQNRRMLLTWPMRFDTIMGIARGLLYLHHDSRLKIIHRDLKTSNILLDKNLKPKISDFGLARIFEEDQSIARTRRVAGTYGYIAPEYAVDGKFSMKSDIFSLGVVLLEIISGKKNRGFVHGDHYHSLLGHAWLLWKANKILELMDECLNDTFIESQVRRCIHVGLLCVQKLAKDRPIMSSVLSMLATDEANLSEPKEPGFFIERSSIPETNCTSPSFKSENATITTTDLEAR